MTLSIREQAAYDPCPVNWLRPQNLDVNRRRNHPDKCECRGTDLRWPTLSAPYFEDHCQPTCVETREGHHHGRLANPTLGKIHAIVYGMDLELNYHRQAQNFAPSNPTPKLIVCVIGYDDRCRVTRGLGTGQNDLDAACEALLDTRGEGLERSGFRERHEFSPLSSGAADDTCRCGGGENDLVHRVPVDAAPNAASREIWCPHDQPDITPSGDNRCLECKRAFPHSARAR